MNDSLDDRAHGAASSVRENLSAQSIPPWLSLLALAPLMYIFIRAPLFQSLWLDETVTRWIIDASPQQVTARTLAFQGQSPLYYLFLSGWSELFGTSEFVLRLPSLIAYLGTLVVLYSLAEIPFRDGRGLPTVLAFLFLDPSLVAALSARPYAMALFFSAMSVLYFMRALGDGRSFRLFIALGLTVVAFYLHYLFLGVVFVHGIVWYVLRDRRRARDLRTIAWLLGVAFLFLLPGLAHMRMLFMRREELGFVVTPSVLEALAGMLPIPFLVALLAAVVIPLILRRASLEWRDRDERRWISVYGIWAFLPPCIAFAISSVSDTCLFLARYLLWTTPGLALFGGTIIALLRPRHVRALAVGVMVFFLLLREGERNWGIENWREAFHVLERSEELAPKDPILLYSGLIESDSFALSAQEAGDAEEYLVSPAYAYLEQERPVIALPGDLERTYTKERVAELLTRLRRVGRAHFVFISLQQRRRPKEKEAFVVHEAYLNSFVHEGYQCAPLFDQERIVVFTCHFELAGIDER